MKLAYTISFLLYSYFVHGQSFDFFFDEKKESELKTVCELTNNYLAGGSLEKDRWQSSYALLALFNDSGDTLQTRRMGGTSDERDVMIDLACLPEDRFAALSTQGEKAVLSLFNQQWNELWSYQDLVMEDAISLIQTNDGGFALCGICESDTYNNGDRAICVTKTDQNGKHLWTEFIGEGKQLKAYSLSAASNGGILVTAWRKTDVNDPHLILLDDQGKAVWQKSLAMEGISYIFDTTVDKDGNIGLTGDTSGPSLPFLIKLDKDGNLLWKQVYEGDAGNFRGYALASTMDGGFVIAGRTTDAKGFILKSDGNGNQQWLRIFNGKEKAGFQDVVELKSGGFMAAGITLDRSSQNAYLVKTNESGKIE